MLQPLLYAYHFFTGSLSADGTDEVEYLLGRVGHVAQGRFFIHSFFQRHGFIDDRKEGIDTLPVTFDGIRRRASCQGNDFGTVLFGQFRHANGGLAHGRLSIEASFAGDDIISIFNGISQADRIEDNLDS